MSRPTVCVIGGGPAGLMAAEILAADGSCRVLVHERMPTVGRKFLMAGRGGLNLTHSEALESFIGRYRAAAGWLAPMLEAFPPAEVIAWAEGLAQPTFIGTSGRIFPRSMKASPLLRAWLARLTGLRVEMALASTWTGFDGATGHPVFVDAAGRAHVEPADAVVLALGGASWPRLGSNGAWVPLLRAHGVEIADLAPANMGCHIAWTPHMARHLGRPLKRIAVSVDGPDGISGPWHGEAMITASGLEGGAIYAISSRIRDALAAGSTPRVLIDLRPDVTVDELGTRLAKAPAKRSLSTRLQQAAGLSPAALAILRDADHGAPLPSGARDLAHAVKSVTLAVTGTGDLQRAISSAGGVRRTAVEPDLMLSAVPGVFVAGEMLDWDAPTGGYLLQATFATAVAAAHGVRTWLAGGHRLGQHSRKRDVCGP